MKKKFKEASKKRKTDDDKPESDPLDMAGRLRGGSDDAEPEPETQPEPQPEPQPEEIGPFVIEAFDRDTTIRLAKHVAA